LLKVALNTINQSINLYQITMVVCFLNPLMRYNYKIHTLKTIKCGRSICIIQKHASVRFYVRILRDLIRKLALHDQFDAQKNNLNCNLELIIK
jgi:hypothetical protein